MAFWKPFRVFGNDSDSSSRGTVDTLGALLPEIFSGIFLYLDIPSCAAVSISCRTFNVLNNSVELWAKRRETVRSRCEDMIALGLLPSGLELQYLFDSLLELPGNVSQDYIDRLACRILLTCRIVLSRSRKDDAQDVAKFVTLCSEMPGKIRKTRITYGFKRGLEAVETGGWLYLTRGKYHSKGPDNDENVLRFDKSVNILGQIRPEVREKTKVIVSHKLRSSICHSVLCLIPPNCGDYNVSFCNLKFDALNEKVGPKKKYATMTICDAPLEKSWSLRGGLSDLFGDGKKDEEKLKAVKLRGTVHVHGGVFKQNYCLSVACNRVDAFVNGCTFKPTTLLLADPHYFSSNPPGRTPVITRHCAFDALDKRITSYWIQEFRRLVDECFAFRLVKQCDDAIEATDKLLEELGKEKSQSGYDSGSPESEKRSQFESRMEQLAMKKLELESAKFDLIRETKEKAELKKREKDESQKQEESGKNESKNNKSDLKHNYEVDARPEPLELTDSSLRFCDLITSLVCSCSRFCSEILCLQLGDVVVSPNVKNKKMKIAELLELICNALDTLRIKSSETNSPRKNSNSNSPGNNSNPNSPRNYSSSNATLPRSKSSHSGYLPNSPSIPLRSATNPALVPDFLLSIIAFRTVTTIIRAASKLKPAEITQLYSKVRHSNLQKVAINSLRTRKECMELVLAIFEFLNHYSVCATEEKDCHSLEDYEIILSAISYYLSIPRVNASPTRSVADLILEWFWKSLQPRNATLKELQRRICARHASLFGQVILRAEDLSLALPLVGEFAVIFAKESTLDEKLKFIENGGLHHLTALKHDHFLWRTELKWKSVCLLFAKKPVRKKFYADIASRSSYQDIQNIFDENTYAKLIRCLCLQKKFDPSLWKLLEEVIMNTEDCKVFNVCADSIMNLLTRSRSGDDSNIKFDPSLQVNSLAHKLIAASDRLNLSPEQKIWISTIENVIAKDNFLDTYLNFAQSDFFGVRSFRPQSSHGVFSVDGRSVRCRCVKNHARFAMSHALKSGKWYYECQLITDCGIVYLGWCTHQYRFSLEPKLLGECDGAWCYNVSKRSLFVINAQRGKYGTHVKFSAGGTVQIYLDCDAKVMAFGYDGKFLGIAFKDFAIDEHGLYPACLIDSENELRFSFCAEDFKFGPDESWKNCKPYSDAKKTL